MKQTKFCPECGSTDILISPTALEAATGMNPLSRCNRCGFESVVFPVKEQEMRQ